MSKDEHSLPQSAARALKYLVLAGGAFLMVFPFVWMMIASVMTAGEIQMRPPVWLPAQPQFDNYSELARSIPIGRLYFNSLFTSGIIVLGVLLSSSLAGFAFAKYRFPGRELLFYLILATMMIPFFVTLIPVFFIVRQLGWIDTYQGLVVPGLASAYGIFLMRQFMVTVPDELLDAARIDGASEPMIYWRIVIPLVKPALATLGTFTFIGAWNNFLWPLLVLNSRELFTLPLGINSLRSLYADNTNLLMAGTAVAVVPMLLLFVFLQRYFIKGIALTGLKG
ncbi:MAG: carbohydrate ABC transporter permease [Chloroflexota bacterium]|nr:carbohydrate ABC transporter permease [Chloroflexota bacterium]MDE2949331.1 carbohydrate ABC transporter permease [Chloroflexota bacterium]